MSSEITEISYSPNNITSGTNLSIVLTLSDYQVEEIKLTYCRITPDYFCHLPILNLQNSSAEPNQFSITFIVKETQAMTFGVQILIKMKDNSTVTFPDSTTPEFGFEIREPVLNQFYYLFVLEGNLNTSNSKTDFWQTSVTSVILFLFIVSVLNRLKYKT